MNLDLGIDLHEAALIFRFSPWGIELCIVVTTSIEHLLKSLSAVEKGKLSYENINQVINSFNNTNRTGLA
ncbi:MAG: hypothetical protein PVH88_15110 [Ignavibacteria bacterium]|jgi:hypothetical protein